MWHFKFNPDSSKLIKAVENLDKLEPTSFISIEKLDDHLIRVSASDSDASITIPKTALIELALIMPSKINSDYILQFNGQEFTIIPYDSNLANQLTLDYFKEHIAIRSITPKGTYYNSNQEHMELLFTILDGMPVLQDHLTEITLAATTGNIRKGFVIKDEVGIQIVQQGYLSLFNIYYYNLYQFEYQALMSLIHTWLSLPDAHNIPNLGILKSKGYLIVYNVDK